MVHGRVVSFADVADDDQIFIIAGVDIAGFVIAGLAGHGEAHRVRAPVGRKFTALPGITDVAEIPQLCITRFALHSSGGATSMEPGAQGQPGGEWPVEPAAPGRGVKIRTSHNADILVLMACLVLDFLL